MPNVIFDGGEETTGTRECRYSNGINSSGRRGEGRAEPTEKAVVLVVVRHPIGGIRTYLRYTYRNLDSRRYRFIVVAVTHPKSHVLRSDLKDLEVEFHEIPARFATVNMARAVATTLMVRRVDLIHSQGSSSALVSSAINLFFGRPHIATFHETFDEDMPPSRWAAMQRRVMAWLFSRADYLNPVSEDARVNLLRKFPALSKRAARIRVIPNGVDMEYFSEESSEDRDVHRLAGLDSETFAVGYLGRFMPEKGFGILIDAVDQLRNIVPRGMKFKILAVGWGGYVREYTAAIKSRNLEQYVVFLDYQPDVRWIVRTIDLLAIPSLREAFCLLAVEGLVMGTPIVASDCIGLRETLRGTPARLVPPGNPAEFARVIASAMQHSGKESAAAFREEAKRRYDVRNTVIALDKLFQCALHRGEKGVESA